MLHSQKDTQHALIEDLRADHGRLQQTLSTQQSATALSAEVFSLRTQLDDLRAEEEQHSQERAAWQQHTQAIEAANSHLGKALEKAQTAALERELFFKVQLAEVQELLLSTRQ
jgi:hypothetical protein